MVKFKCLQTGNVFSFEAEHDVASMREHPDYEEVTEDEEEKQEIKPKFRRKFKEDL